MFSSLGGASGLKEQIKLQTLFAVARHRSVNHKSKYGYCPVNFGHYNKREVLIWVNEAGLINPSGENHGVHKQFLVYKNR